MIGYDLAGKLFKLIEGSTLLPPKSWIGSLSNVTYKLGGSLDQKRSIMLNVFNERKISKIYNVIGMIRGTVEPGESQINIKLTNNNVKIYRTN